MHGYSTKLASDAKLYEKLLANIPPADVTAFCRDQKFEEPFPAKRWDVFSDFLSAWDRDPARRFLNKEIDDALQTLYDSIRAFDACLRQKSHQNTGPGISTMIYQVPPEWESENPSEYAKTIEELHSLAHSVAEDYDSLVTTARSCLGQ